MDRSSDLDHEHEDNDEDQQDNDQSDNEANEKDDNDDGGNVFSSWPDEETAKLIELFRSREYLYNTSHKYYHRRDKKDAAYSAIAKALGGLPC